MGENSLLRRQTDTAGPATLEWAIYQPHAARGPAKPPSAIRVSHEYYPSRAAAARRADELRQLRKEF